jgi:hypothetical protein
MLESNFLYVAAAYLFTFAILLYTFFIVKNES